MFSQLNIQNRLALVLWSSVLLAYLVAGIGLAIYQSVTLESRAQRIMQPYAQLISVGSDAAVAFQDHQRAQEVLDTLRANPQILQAGIYLDNGHILASFSRNQKTMPDIITQREDGIYIEEHRVVLLQSLHSGAHLRISMDLAQLNEQTRQAVWLFAAGALILLLASIAQFTVLRRMIVRPIATLTRAAEHVRSSGDFKYRVPASGNDEVARLGQSFNAMMGVIHEKQQLLLEAQHIAHVGNWWHDVSSGELFWSEEIFKILGRDPATPSIEQAYQLIHPDDVAVLEKAVQVSRQTQGDSEQEFRIMRPNGEVRWVNNRWVAVFDNSGNLVQHIGTLQDITERKEAEKQIEHLAYYDLLTKLPNRRLLLDRLHQAALGSVRSRNMGALLFIDLDNFKILNDTSGHDIGDKLLIEVASRLGTCVRDGDTISRLGGDEFVIILEDLSQTLAEAAAHAKLVGEKIISVLNQPYQIADRLHHSTPSIGATLFNGSEDSVDELLKQADIAMYQAKTAGRNTLRFFDPETQAKLAARAEMETELRLSLQNENFVLHYQAQVDKQNQIIAAEALVRWQHPQKGLMPPGQFIPLAEETGLILPLGQWVLENACQQLAKWSQDPDKQHLDLAVNVSAIQFRQKDFIYQVKQALKTSGAPVHHLKLELTETLVLVNVQDSIEKMRILKALGVGFSMDDFGTGYSSLSYLTRLPLDQLKIDGSFIRNLPDNVNDSVVVQTIIQMAGSLGLKLIAEGVETDAQRAFLEQQGCHVYQGYLFSKPVELAAFEALMESKNHFC